MADHRREPPPLRTNDVRTVTIGTLAWVIFLLVLVPLRDTLERNGLLWWYPMSLCGIGLGLIGLYATRRRAARAGNPARRNAVPAGEGLRTPPA